MGFAHCRIQRVGPLLTTKQFPMLTLPRHPNGNIHQRSHHTYAKPRFIQHLGADRHLLPLPPRQRQPRLGAGPSTGIG